MKSLICCEASAGFECRARGLVRVRLDHDVTERDRMNRVLALFQERSTIDELGLGSIRDSILDDGHGFGSGGEIRTHEISSSAHRAACRELN